MSGPDNAVMGDMGDPTSLPESQVDEQNLVEEKKMARFSKTAEYKRLETYINGRIDFFKKYLPNGKPVAGEGPTQEMVNNWVIANTVIGEFDAILGAYNDAQESVKDA